MDERDQEMKELAELYPLGGLEPEERAAVESYLASEGCRDAITRGRTVAYALAARVAQEPPSGLRSRVLSAAHARGATQQPNVAGVIRPWWTQPAWLTAAAAVVVVIFAATFAYHSLSPRSWAVTCAAAAISCPSASRVVAWSSNALTFEARGMAAPPAGKVYQAWFIRAGAKPTPAPTFSPDASGTARVTLPVGAEQGLTVAITVEPQGGSQAPTTKPFLVASIN
jgi:anti-sigma-K factor RskA